MRIQDLGLVGPLKRPQLQVEFIGPFQTERDNRIRSEDFLKELWEEPSQEDYVPELSKYPTPKELLTKSIQGKIISFKYVKREFPGVHINDADDYDSFRETPTFFRSVGSPKGLDDLYGEPYRLREHLYVLGSINRPHDLEFFSSEELRGMFLEEKRFANPKSREKTEFTNLQVNRLEFLSSRGDQALHDIIQRLKLQKTEAVTAARQLFEKDREQFKECLMMMLEVAMYMRGWTGDGEYPLTSSQAYREVDQVTLSVKLEIFLGRLKNEWSGFSRLALIRGGETTSWAPSGDKHKTLRARTRVVISGKHPESCIRATSTLFATTAWFYLNTLYSEVPFSIQRLGTIF